MRKSSGNGNGVCRSLAALCSNSLNYIVSFVFIVGNSRTLIFTTNVQKTKEFASKASIANMYYSLLSLASFLTINLVQFQPHLTISGLIGKSEHIVSILPKKWEQFYLLCTQSWHLHKITFLWNTQVNENEQCELF